MRKITFVLTILFFLAKTSPVFAARSLVIESYKQSFTNDEEGEVKVLLNDFTNGESIFIKGAFSYPDSTNYFGFTKKGDTWVKNSITAADQLSIKIGEWDGKLSVKPDLSDTGFNGSGNYNFKVGFYYYTGGGNLSSVNWSDTKSVNITFVPSPTPTPTSTPTPTATPVPTSVPTSLPTNSPVPSATPKPQSTPTKYISPTIKLTVTPSPVQDKSEGAVLGEVSEPSITKTEEKQINTSENKKSYLPIFVLLFGGGILFITAAVAVSVKNIRKDQKASGKSDFLL